MSSGGFWPGESPAAEEDDARELPVAETASWSPPEPEERVEAERAEPEPEPPPPFLAEPAPDPSDLGGPEPPLMAPPEPTFEPEPEPEPEPPIVPEAEAAVEAPAAEPALEPEPEPEPELELPPVAPAPQHIPGELDLPDDVAVLEGSASGADRTVGVVVSRFNGEITNRLLASALEALEAAGVPEARITVMPVPGAFELPIGAMALAKTRRYSCVVALGCVIRGETPHFDYVATEAASGLQLAGLETGVPVAFGLLTVDTVGQAEERTDKGADAARAALEMADLFSQLRSQARG